MVSHATQWWAVGKKTGRGYHRKMLATPLASMNSDPATSGIRLSRSRAWATPRTGGHRNRWGKTAQSLASRSGIAAIPVATWTPWVTW
jgi:hypothetical protein